MCNKLSIETNKTKKIQRQILLAACASTMVLVKVKMLSRPKAPRCVDTDKERAHEKLIHLKDSSNKSKSGGDGPPMVQGYQVLPHTPAGCDMDGSATGAPNSKPERPSTLVPANKITRRLLCYHGNQPPPPSSSSDNSCTYSPLQYSQLNVKPPERDHKEDAQLAAMLARQAANASPSTTPNNYSSNPSSHPTQPPPQYPSNSTSSFSSNQNPGGGSLMLSDLPEPPIPVSEIGPIPPPPMFSSPSPLLQHHLANHHRERHDSGRDHMQQQQQHHHHQQQQHDSEQEDQDDEEEEEEDYCCQ
uniref:Uncharacterized protein n=1 Tax=Cacopsylla melanoneura TaxID=428564 RepID=A0A8D8LVY9_9HEMI